MSDVTSAISCLLRLAVLVVRGHARPCQFSRAADLGAGHEKFHSKAGPFVAPGLGASVELVDHGDPGT